MKNLIKLIENRRPGISLEQDFFCDKKIFEADIEYIWGKEWLFAGFEAQIPNSGDYVLYNLSNESVIIIRGNEGQLHAHFNTCRHRGSIICTEEKGNARNLICPYHCWVYEKNGDLKAARLMPKDFDKTEYGLKSVHLEILDGLIFICLANSPKPFTSISTEFQPYLEPFEFANAKIARQDRYECHGNWKLFAQNFRECYHCGPAHPEYCNAVVGANFMEDDELSDYWEESKNNWRKKGLAINTVNINNNSSHYAVRYPLRKGVKSYSLDGNPVSSLMGRHVDFDNGVVGLVTFPNFWLDAVSDYAWAMRITPKDATSCFVDITFLVDKDAIEGKDYKLNTLTQFWDITGGQDWELIKNNQKGIETDSYSPGPYANVEEEVKVFDNWYISKLKLGLNPKREE